MRSKPASVAVRRSVSERVSAAWSQRTVVLPRPSLSMPALAEAGDQLVADAAEPEDDLRLRVPLAEHEGKAGRGVHHGGDLGQRFGQQLLDAVVAQEDAAGVAQGAQLPVDRAQLVELALGGGVHLAQAGVRPVERVGEHAGEQADEHERRHLDGHAVAGPSVRQAAGVTTAKRSSSPGLLDEERRPVDQAGADGDQIGGPRRQQQAGEDDRPDVEDRQRRSARRR